MVLPERVHWRVVRRFSLHHHPLPSTVVTPPAHHPPAPPPLLPPARYDEVEAERNELYENFEGTVRAVQRKSHLKNMVLEQRVEGMVDACEAKQEQLGQVLHAANLDPAVLSMVAQRLDQVLDGRNAQIKNLQCVGVWCRCRIVCRVSCSSAVSRCCVWRVSCVVLCVVCRASVVSRYVARGVCCWCPAAACPLPALRSPSLPVPLSLPAPVPVPARYAVARVAKAHNDILRVYASKLAALGVPVDEDEFPPLAQGAAGGSGMVTTTGPAGLVAMPTT